MSAAKYIRHQGQKEKARRLKQAERRYLADMNRVILADKAQVAALLKTWTAR